MSSLTLIPFKKSNTDLILGWRNSERVRSNMLDDSIISLEKHYSFIEILKKDPTKSYFVMELNNQPVGAIYFNGIGSSCITWGCYIGVEKVIPGFFVLLIIVAMNFAFSYETTLSLHSEVAAHNLNPIKVNKFLGISVVNKNTKFTTSNNETEFLEYEVNRESSDLVLGKAFKILPSSMKGLIENLNIGKYMNIRNIILDLLNEVLEATDSNIVYSELSDEVVLLDSGLDSLGFAILVARLEEELEFDPFVEMEDAVYPTTFGEFVAIYENRK